MPRALRADKAGCWHHVMNRGARRESIFRRDVHCEIFLGLLDEAARRNGVEVHAYALMPNHYHLLVRSMRGRLSRAMQQLNGRYTQILNKRHGWDGPLFRGRFRSQLIHDAVSLQHEFAYIHLNPIRARLARGVEDDCWTSLLAYLGKSRRPRWLKTRSFLKALGGADGIRGLIERRRKRPEEWPEGMDLETGWLPEPDRVRRIDIEIGRERATGTPVDAVLAKVCAIADCSPRDMRRAERGPTASPRRRFAVWALSHQLSAREVGKVLRMTPNAVTKVLQRMRSGRAPLELRDWMIQFTGDD